MPRGCRGKAENIDRIDLCQTGRLQRLRVSPALTMLDAMSQRDRGQGRRARLLALTAIPSIGATLLNDGEVAIETANDLASRCAGRPPPRVLAKMPRWPGQQAYLTKLRYEASASISSGPKWPATIGIGDPGLE